MFAYPANQTVLRPSLTTQRSTAAAGAINGAAVDTGDLLYPILAAVNAPVASASDTITFTVQDSADGSTDWQNINAAYLLDPNTGDPATFTQVTDAVAVAQVRAIRKENVRRYLRLVATTAGSGIDVTFFGAFIGNVKYT